MNLIAGAEQFVGVDQQVEAVEDAGRFLEGEQGVGGRRQLGVEHRRGVEHRDAGAQRLRRSSARFRRAPSRPACSAVKKRAESWRKGRSAGRSAFDRVERRRALGDRFLDEGPRDAGEGGEGAVEGDEDARLLSRRPGRRWPRGPPAPARSRRSWCSARPALAQGRLAAFGQPAQGAEGVVELRAAAGEGVAEAGQVLRGSRAGSFRRTCRRTGRCRPVRAAPRRAGSFRRRRSPCFESPGTICRYLRPSGDLGRMIIVELTGSGSAFLSRLRLSSAATLPLPSAAPARPT